MTGRSSAVFDRSIDVLMSRLRTKLEKDMVKQKMFTTVRNGGYLFSCRVNRKMTAIAVNLLLS